MAKIAIIGGHGKVALILASMLTARGDEVDAIIRNRDQAPEVAATGANPVIADVETANAAALADLLAGHDAVVWSAGAGGGNPERTYAVDRDAAIRSMDAALAAGVRRYVMVSYFGARVDHGVPPESSFHAYAESKAGADEYLRGTDLDWTVLGPSSLTLDPPTGRIDTDAESSGSVGRADVADVIAETLRQPLTVGRTIRFNAGSTPIAEALARD
ncbi:SDR family oxidoreductase [Agromyces seonyuensis]|uniref:NAD(P)H-binding protein n=1 Tax=Agromyces seonyuensis TaxID=2662446 RepID=A0A6I4NZ78_9MICO|nr:SDR family oxidoreductase [Agromyces seonyuensis]MWB99613.1 NAD(P)H-binding protein [Agromyces seonyuensis]